MQSIVNLLDAILALPELDHVTHARARFLRDKMAPSPFASIFGR